MVFFRSFQTFVVGLSAVFAISALPTITSPVIASTRPATTHQEDWLKLAAVPKQGVPLNLWATFYYIHRAASLPFGGLPLLDQMDNPLGPLLSHRDWCYAALQGTVMVEEPRPSVIYNFAGRGLAPQVDCSPFFSSLSPETIAKVNRVRFKVSTATYGYGTAGFQLVPYRTIAVDRNRIPIGSVLYIPAARGTPITLPSGQRVTHDGYFFAGDVGSAIQKNQIDVFIGTAERNPFPFVTSRRNGAFRAYLVQDSAISQALWNLHKL